MKAIPNLIILFERGRPGSAILGVDYRFILIGQIVAIPFFIFLIYFGYKDYKKRKEKRERNNKK